MKSSSHDSISSVFAYHSIILLLVPVGGINLS